jgi:cytoskeletal protein CcmA (bactofilin family)
MHTKFWSGRLKGKCEVENVVLGGRVILNGILEKQDVKVWSGFKCLRMGFSERI